MNSSLALFTELPKAQAKPVEVLPISVLEIGPQIQDRREIGGHDSNSSRAEYSHFPSETASLCYQLYLRDAHIIFDPFAGWGERHSFSLIHNKKYVGFDCSKESIKYASELYGVKNTLANSLSDELPEFDGFITCPPYWNLEKYSASGLDSAPTWLDFLSGYKEIISRCVTRSNIGTVFCIQVGDWRDDGIYYPLTHETRKAFENAGASIVDEVIISRRTVSKIKVMLPQAIRLGYTVKVHETLLVFKKETEK